MLQAFFARAGRWLAAAALMVALAPAVAQAADHPEGVRIEMTDELGPVLADSRGRTLYNWNGDRNPGESLCKETRYTNVRGAGSVIYDLPDQDTRPVCSQIWPPFVAAADAQPVGEWSLIKRDGGVMQWAYQGKPLYTFAHDSQAGEINGAAGFSGRVLSGRYPVWAPQDVPRGLLTSYTRAGRVLMTDEGKVLYFQSGGGVTKASTCSGDCLKSWKPLPAPAVGRAPQGWTLLSLGDGRRQWAFQGKALYTFSGDSTYAALDGADEPGWKPMVLQQPLAPPPGLTVQITAAGEVFADGKGMTLYSWGCGDEGPDRALCDIPGATQTYRLSICGAPAKCIATWKPVIAPPGAKPVGRTWSVVDVDPTGAQQYAKPGDPNALKVWAYRGRPLYTYAGDKEPGDMNGDAQTSGAIWGYGMLRADGRNRAF